MPYSHQKPADRQRHPYRSGNFAPVSRTLPLTPCTYSGSIPPELAGGQYVRNGANPLRTNDHSQEAHWFDGDGMLSGVLFRCKGNGTEDIVPEFVNQYVLTDIYLYAKDKQSMNAPPLPSITTLVNPLASVLTILAAILRTVFLSILSHLSSSQAIKKISVANTAILWHDGRALATCESGPPMRILLPSLETIGWFNGRRSEHEPGQDSEPGFGGSGPLQPMKEWTTGHPRVDPITKELISFHAVFVKPYVYYSIVPSAGWGSQKRWREHVMPTLNAPVPGVMAPKMMHDFGVSRQHTVIMDLPLFLDPLNMARGRPVLHYDPTQQARFGVFPRYRPYDITWFETKSCVIFHTANCWDIDDCDGPTINLLACRLTSASLVYEAGALPTPSTGVSTECSEQEQCRLYFFCFSMQKSAQSPLIRNQWALSAIAFEFPTLNPSYSMAEARYVYGCSTRSESYSTALGKGTKIEFIAKIDVQTLIARGTACPPPQVTGCVDNRTVADILGSTDRDDPIKLFAMPEGWYAQECRFVPHRNARSEDQGWLLTYVFDESQLTECGDCKEDACSELWIIDATEMKDIVARIRLPQRVPYGLHGNWFSKDEIELQRPYTSLNRLPREVHDRNTGSEILKHLADFIEAYLK